MTINDYNGMNHEEKISWLSKAKKITERIEECTKYELFQLGNFFIEIRFCIRQQFKKIVNTYVLKELPQEYVAEVLAIPIVSANK
jgi:hypothetical protein